MRDQVGAGVGVRPELAIALAVSVEAGVSNGIDQPYRYKVSVRISGFDGLANTSEFMKLTEE